MLPEASALMLDFRYTCTTSLHSWSPAPGAGSSFLVRSESKASWEFFLNSPPTPLLRTPCTLWACDRLEGDQFRRVVAHCNYKPAIIHSAIYSKSLRRSSFFPLLLCPFVLSFLLEYSPGLPHGFFFPLFFRFSFSFLSSPLALNPLV